MRSCISLVVATGSILVSGLAPPDLADLLEQVKSPDRITRSEAAEKLAGVKPLPESAAGPVIEFIKLEVESATTPDPTAKRFTEQDTLPKGEGNVSLSRIKAFPNEYLNKTFVMAGAVQNSDYYNYGYTDSAPTHYAFRFTAAGADGAMKDEGEGIYVLRFLGRALAEAATRADESKGLALAVRLKCTIQAARCEGELANATRNIEILDWQFVAPGGHSWLPWAYGNVDLGYSLLYATGRQSIPKCLDLLMDDKTFRNETADQFLRWSAIIYLSRLPRPDRTVMLRQIQTRAKRVKSVTAKTWAARAYQAVSSGKVE